MEYVEIARARSERGEVVLRELREPGRPAVLELRVNGVYVMDSAHTSTERALATAALAAVPTPHDVLVGGLGLGVTAQAVLADPRVRSCTVVEIEPALVEWLRTGVIPGGPVLLADARLQVHVGDVVDALAAARPGSLDLILLDVDNGPDQLVHLGNARLYRPPFLRTVRAALRPDGRAVIWSAAESPALAAGLHAVFDEVRVRCEPVRLQGRNEHHWLYMGTAASLEPGGRRDIRS